MEFVSQIHFCVVCVSSGRRLSFSSSPRTCVSLFSSIYYYLSETWLDHFVSFFSLNEPSTCECLRPANATNFTCTFLPSICASNSGLFPSFFLSFDAHAHKRNENIFLSAVGCVPLFFVGEKKILSKKKKLWKEKQPTNGFLLNTVLLCRLSSSACFYKAAKTPSE